MKRKTYEAPHTRKTRVELESGFMAASIIEGTDKHDKGLSTEEHKYADPGKSWEGDYKEWDQ